MELYTIRNCPHSKIIEVDSRGRRLYCCKKYNQTLREGAGLCIPCLEFMNFEFKYKNLFEKEIESDNEIKNSIVSSLFGGVPPEIRYCSLISVGRKFELEDTNQIIKNSKGCIVYIKGEFREGKSFFLRLLCDSLLSKNSNSFCTSLVELDDYTTFYDYPSIVKKIIKNLHTPDYRGKHKYFSNGLDALIYRFVFQYYDDFERRHETSLQYHSLREMLDEIKELFNEKISLYKKDISLIDKFLENAVLSNSDYSVFTEYFSEDKIRSNNAIDLLQFIVFLCDKCGYKLAIAIDELEKSTRNFKHFDSINTFIEMFPSINFVFSGTHNLLTGGTDSIENIHPTLFYHLNEHLIKLEEMKKEDFVDLIKKLEGFLPPPQKNYFEEEMENKGGYKTFVERFLLEYPNKTIGNFLICFKEALRLSHNSESVIAQNLVDHRSKFH